MSASEPAPVKKNQPLSVFLCHYSGDKTAVRDLYDRLKADGFEPWLDEENLLPGQTWQREIPIALRTSDVVIILISGSSLRAEGYVHKELTEALSVAQEKPEGTIFIIPARLEEVEIPLSLAHWHWANLYEPDGYERLKRALDVRARALGRFWQTRELNQRQTTDKTAISGQAVFEESKGRKPSFDVSTRMLPASEAYNVAKAAVLRAKERVLSVVDWTAPWQPNAEARSARDEYYASLFTKVRESPEIEYKRIIQLPHANATTMKYNAPFVSHLSACIEARDAKQNPAKNIGIFSCHERQIPTTFLIVDENLVFIEFAELVMLPNGDKCSQLDKVLMIGDSTGELPSVFKKMFSNLMSYCRKMEPKDIKRFERIVNS